MRQLRTLLCALSAMFLFLPLSAQTEEDALYITVSGGKEYVFPLATIDKVTFGGDGAMEVRLEHSTEPVVIFYTEMSEFAEIGGSTIVVGILMEEPSYIFKRIEEGFVLEGLTGSAIVTLVDMQGRQAARCRYNAGDAPMRFDNLASGIYIVCIVSSEGSGYAKIIL